VLPALRPLSVRRGFYRAFPDSLCSVRPPSSPPPPPHLPPFINPPPSGCALAMVALRQPPHNNTFRNCCRCSVEMLRGATRVSDQPTEHQVKPAQGK